MSGKSRISIFTYRDYRIFLRDFFEKHIKAKGLSYRSVTKRGKIANPSYLQQVIEGKRNLSEDSALKVAYGLRLDEGETKFLLALVRFEREAKAGKIEKGLELLRSVALDAKIEDRKEDNIYSSWLHGVIWALVGIPGLKLTVEEVGRYMRGIATTDEIAKSIAFIKDHDFVEPLGDADLFAQKALKFAPINDVRSLEIQRNHVRFLDLAKLRILDPIDDREYQGMTISVAKAQLPFVKKELRAFMANLHEKLSHDPEAEAVLRIQCSAFWVTRDPKAGTAEVREKENDNDD